MTPSPPPMIRMKTPDSAAETDRAVRRTKGPVFENGKRVIVQPPPEWLEALKLALAYDPQTGAFTWRVRRASRKAGGRAGTFNRSTGYHQIRFGGRSVWAQQAAWFFKTGAWPTQAIDHRNGHRTDNRAENLRQATEAQNQFTRRSTNTLSRYRGVAPNCRKWVATLGRQYLGLFSTEEAAARAHDRAAIARDPEFARTNFPREDYA